MAEVDVYPEELRRSEQARLEERARFLGREPQLVQAGAALSGGGIRSATFCLGVFQALAKHDLLGRFDFLSTVSGGGYFGSFLGAMIHREGIEGAQRRLKDPSSAPVQWLREHGRYMSPNGAGDLLVAAAVLLRNWVAVQVVIVAFLLPFTALVAAGRLGYWSSKVTEGWWLDVPDPAASAGVLWSPWLLVACGPLLLLLLFGGSYWLTQHETPMRWIGGSGRGNEFTHRSRNFLSRAAAEALLVTVILAAVGAFDTLGTSLYHWSPNTLPASTGALAVGAFAFGLAQKLSMLLDKLPRGKALRVPIELVALAAAFLWVALLLLGLLLLTECVAWDGATIQWPYLGLLLLVPALFSHWFSKTYGFVNLSSHQQLYAARLKRAYIGASNPKRIDPEQRVKNCNRITEPISGDDVPTEQYDPPSKGGPLHLINVTVNETLSGKSQIEQRDRKGLPLAIGPSGVSLGLGHHALWDDGGTPRKDRRGARAVAKRGFHAFDGVEAVESLALGNWIAISGAAFTTGLGSRTSLGLSLLLGLANIRLGYWWDSGVRPSGRSERTPPRGSGRLREWMEPLIPVQISLLDELLARFHGPARRHWYLSDGGHFENTGCYELLRRRVPFILATDGGCDGSYEFGDIANLVRKARTDFGAQIELLSRGEIEQLVANRVLLAELGELLGGPEDFRPVPAALAEPSAPCNAKRHALLARVTYLDTQEVGAILFLKPSLTGDEPMDLLQYQRAQPSFPQESTMDQNFDEAQWESYRRLGEHIAEALFALSASHTSWTPSRMSCPFVRGTGG